MTSWKQELLFKVRYLPLTNKAFTLAEVLITLGIIGVVAAITIPILYQGFAKDQTISQLKATYSILNNALDMAKVDYGLDINNWYIPNDSTANASTYFAQTYLIPYLKTTQICGTSTSSDCQLQDGFLSNATSATKQYTILSGSSSNYSFTLVNGAVVQVRPSSLNGNSVSACRIQLYFDINGAKTPNIIGKDSFLVELGGNYGAGDKNKFMPYCWGYARTQLLNMGDTTSCSNKNGALGYTCFALIMSDGWKIANDYPW